MPIGWETHAVPEMGDHPQSIINRQLLQGCDALVGIFWTRLGTPTQKYPSGSVEEIEEHMQSGKPTMIYFSSAPVVPDSIEPDQYAALKAFKESCKGRGLFEIYNDLNGFRTAFNRHLHQKIVQDPYFKRALQDGIVQVPSDRHIDRVTSDAETLLRRCAESADGMILHLRSMSGVDIQVGNLNFITDQAPRNVARWEGALQELDEHEMINGVGLKHEIFKITRAGYDYYDLFLK
jgi:hypothetical protein